MNKKLIPLMALSTLIITSCTGGTKWSWEAASEDHVLNYALLIGQIDHNDSAARTAGIREALGTRPTTQLANANAETPVQGKLTINGVEYTVNEVEHGEQKNTAGATWDAQTASNSAETWLNKHVSSKGYGNEIDFFVSNNDGMAEGAVGATNWVEGMPIFGYDSNATTLTKINEGTIMGTINQNASAQAAGILMLARNCMDGLSTTDAVVKGFSSASTNGYGQISSAYTYHESDHSMLVDNFAITKDNVADYLNKTADDLVDSAVTKGTTANKKVFMSYYSQSDTFLNANMKPLFNQYKDKFNLTITETAGDGNSESSVQNNLESVGAQDAYIINMVKTSATSTYLDMIASKVGATATEPTNVPVIFWNRQGTKADGSVDQTVMADSRFKYIYYVGFDAVQGGQLQGQMIVDYLKGLAK